MATKASSKFFRFFELSYSDRRSAADAKKVIKPKWYEKVCSGLEPSKTRLTSQLKFTQMTSFWNLRNVVSGWKSLYKMWKMASRVLTQFMKFLKPLFTNFSKVLDEGGGSSKQNLWPCATLENIGFTRSSVKGFETKDLLLFNLTNKNTNNC